MSRVFFIFFFVVVVVVGCGGARDAALVAGEGGVVAVVDAISGRPLPQLAVRVDGDSGVRCAVAPCPTETSTWSGTTDTNGLVRLPPQQPALRYRLVAASGGDGVDLDGGAVVRLPPAFLSRIGERFSADEQQQLLTCIQSVAALRALCVKAVARNRDGADGLVKGLTALAADADADVRAAALEALGALPGAPRPPPSADASLRERWLAAAAIAQGKTEVPDDVAAALMAWVEQAPEPAWAASDWVPLSWPYKTLLPPLLKLLRDGTEIQRDRASFIVYQILTIRDASHTGPVADDACVTLLAAMERGPSTVSARAGMALGALAKEHPTLLPALEKLAQSKDPDLHDAAARAVRDAREAQR